MKGCIVIADDDPNIVNLVRLRLGLASYQVLAARDAKEAVALARRCSPTAMILDVQMPGDGLTALAEIKADPALSGLPVMILTGERSAETVMQAMNSGADDYMVKPFHPDRLAERVSRLVGMAVKPAPTWEL
jgi:DNA-binding response OmpR family regulator